MAEEKSILFSPIAIGELVLSGRLIKTATAESRASEDGFATQELIDFYLPMAKGGTPMIITGNIYTSPDGKSTPRQMGAENDDKIPALAQYTCTDPKFSRNSIIVDGRCCRAVPALPRRCPPLT